MSRIFFIRHGQASFLKTNYDQLSEVGKRQAYELGVFWARQGYQVNRIYTGDLVRQKETAEHFLKGYQSDIQVHHHGWFDEHHGPGIVKHIYPDKFHQERDLPVEKFDQYRREFYGTYFQLALPWIHGELKHRLPDDLESWQDFRKRFKEGLTHVKANCPSGSQIMVFTSGGPVAAAVGESLSLNDQHTIQLGWQVKNTSVTEFLYGQDRFSLVSFNGIPHLQSKDLITMV